MSAPLTISSPFQHGEAARLYDLLSLKVMDTPRESVYDSIVDVAAALFETPMSFVSLLDSDRQWIKASCGLGGLQETTRGVSFCAYAITEPTTMIVNDTLLDPRFVSHPFVLGAPFLRFYAGTPLITSKRNAVGTLCVADTKPRRFEEGHYRLLEKLARVVVESLESRRD